jgi:hypothetical protein
VSEDVVGVEDVGGEAFGAEASGCFTAEEFADGSDAVGVSDSRDIAGGLDAQDGNFAGGVVF